MKTFPLICLLVLSAPLFSACSDDDDGPPAAPGFTEVFRFTLDGEAYETDELSAVFTSSPQSLSVTGSFPEGIQAGISMVPIPAVGEHQTGFDLSFSVEFQTESFFCNSDCVVEIIENNTLERRFDARISGLMTPAGFSPDTLVLENGRITANY